jgi:hypothetical protein
MTESDQPTTGGVLSGLPTTRPQRRSPKRSPAPPAAAARRSPAPPAVSAAATRRSPATSTAATTRRSPQRSPAPTATATTRRGRARPTSRIDTPPPAAVPAPGRRAPLASQGFNVARGTVDPPSRTALLGSVVSGAGEIAEIGLTAGRHVLRSIYGRLPHP